MQEEEDGCGFIVGDLLSPDEFLLDGFLDGPDRVLFIGHESSIVELVLKKSSDG